MINPTKNTTDVFVVLPISQVPGRYGQLGSPPSVVAIRSAPNGRVDWEV